MESVVLGRADTEINVVDPVKHGDGVSAYWSYKVHTRTTLPHFDQDELTVHRRFRDFRWLHDRLATRFRGMVLPPLPEKNAMQSKFQSDEKFLEVRRRALAVFLNRLAAHPVLLTSEELKAFLSQPEVSGHRSLSPSLPLCRCHRLLSLPLFSRTLCSLAVRLQDAWAFTVARHSADTSASSSVMSSAMRLFAGWKHSAANLMHGRCDPVYSRTSAVALVSPTMPSCRRPWSPNLAYSVGCLPGPQPQHAVAAPHDASRQAAGRTTSRRTSST